MMKKQQSEQASEYDWPAEDEESKDGSYLSLSREVSGMGAAQG